ncbi:helix-turn-helix domain-containing protein [Roseibium sp. RKSG952]|uniref:winged helix-turn-helix transcriptional regulator n=1 Tax=Roseibium sp. RKSG952 TaxID=2529384 RepID=UPI0018AD23ED|nr:helix-turn-helix domain-containing protein [Roseibium sp. RKSG952]
MTTDWRDVDTTYCGVGACADILSDRWSILILRDILAGVTRFRELQGHIGISPAGLSKRLKQLAEAGIVVTKDYQEPGQRKHAEYQITERGYGLVPAIVSFGQFGYDHLVPPEVSPFRYVDRNTGQAVRVELVREDGQVIKLEDLQLDISEDAIKPGFHAPTSRNRQPE